MVSFSCPFSLLIEAKLILGAFHLGTPLLE